MKTKKKEKRKVMHNALAAQILFFSFSSKKKGKV